MKISNETKVGILATVAIVLLFIGYSFLKGNDVFSSDNTFYTTYDAVDGLTPSKPVLVNGYQIGRVSKMILQPDGKIKTEFKIHSHYQIPKIPSRVFRVRIFWVAKLSFLIWETVRRWPRTVITLLRVYRQILWTK